MANNKSRRQAKIQIITSVILLVVCMGGYLLYQLFVERVASQQIIQSFYPFVLVVAFILIFSIFIIPFEIRKRRRLKNLSEKRNE